MVDHRILFIDFNSYFASVEQQMRPELRGRPVAVVPVITDSTCAIAASYEAKAFGVKTGTRIGDAKKMCPGLVCVLAQHDAYVHFHGKLKKEIDRHIPILRVESIDEMSCELYGRFHEESAAVELAQAIKAGIAENVGVCLTSSIGISTNRFLAKVASDMVKPNGITVLHPSQMPDRLNGLKLRDLPGIGRNMETRLYAKGITTIWQLWHCAPKQAGGLWGSVEGERFWHALHGREVERAETVRRMITHSHVLGPVDRPLARAENVGRRLLLKAASRMRKLNMKATHLDISVRVERGERLEGSVRFSPVCDSFALLKIFGELWAKVVRDRPAHLKKVSLALHGLVPVEAAEQLSLFPAENGVDARSPQQRELRERLSQVLDNVTQRFGRDALTLGLTESDGSSFTGTKIAFNRIPETSDFEQWQEKEARREATGPL
ncbi:impB/mucB/samB family protein [Phragmitibacter flavus]|uniref:ImpB/mucB/samB family protein n=1 Tax=Phragmitibacter flavus TaxID=2576071 RepID=A0A5R8KKV7_9BACT|nr:impB/mucB/samB family protein [Phragmitibacter flavus]TLD72269.1 impB/mucB/samB family protein [Phragmitibacter flavus]